MPVPNQPKIYLYCRVSSETQSAASQLAKLQPLYPTAQTVTEIASGVKARPELDRLLPLLTKDDKLIVTALDRLGRRTSEVLLTIEQLHKKGVILVSLREGIDYSTPAGRLMTQILVAVAEMERELTRERCRAGIAAAQARGVKFGRPRRIEQDRIDYALNLCSDGYTAEEASEATGISAPYIGALRRKAKSA